ncbi:hypothetical protein DPMN_046642 [Dreissena polymorpha]|uniref:Uncharacterized protein n=1 Tax=Dreissena polymorpha TaxID=45954 RepID=A0A9D4D779_DREPO|nr:hypothetical protein DPMN_046642 [Dreissena polymorpha]
MNQHFHNEKYNAMQYLYNAMTDTVKRHKDIVKTQSAAIQSINNQIQRHSETEDMHAPTNTTAVLCSVVAGSGNRKASGVQRLKTNKENGMQSGMWADLF